MLVNKARWCKSVQPDSTTTDVLSSLAFGLALLTRFKLFRIAKSNRYQQSLKARVVVEIVLEYYL